MAPVHVAEWRVRETTLTEGTADLVLAGPMYGSLPFLNGAVMAVGDTCDYVVHYGAVFEAGLGTLAAGGTYGTLQRGATPYRARHANGDINTTKVSLPAGVKTVIMDVRGNKVARVDVVQGFTLAERDRLCQNLGLPKSVDKAICPQATAWVGWTKDTSQHDAGLRIVTDATGGATGGSVNYSTLHGRTTTDSVTLGLNNLPNVSFVIPAGAGDHAHSYTETLYLNVTVQSGSGQSVNVGILTGAPNGGTTVNNTLPQILVPSGGSGAAFTSPIDMRVKFRNVIIITKD